MFLRIAVAKYSMESVLVKWQARASNVTKTTPDQQLHLKRTLSLLLREFCDLFW